MVNLIHFQQNWLHHIMSNQLEPRIAEQMHHILLPPREEIVNDDHIVSSGDQLIDQMTPDETSAARYNNPLPPPANTHRHSPDSIGKLVIITITEMIPNILS